MQWNIKGSRTETFETTFKRNGTDLYKYRNRVWWSYSEYPSRKICSRKKISSEEKPKVRKSLEVRRRKKWSKFLCRAQSSKREKKKMPLLSYFIEKALIENTSQSSNVSENRTKKLRRRAMIFPRPGLHLNKELSGTEE